MDLELKTINETYGVRRQSEAATALWLMYSLPRILF